MPLKVWIIDPYGNLPGEGWRDSRSTMIANALEKFGHEITWWVSNFDHRSKIFRSNDWKEIQVTPRFLIRVVPSTAYTSHISIKRVWYEKTFGKRLHERALHCPPPDVIILREPALFVSGPVLDLVRRWQLKLIVDVIDLWPELFHMILPKQLSWVGKLVFLPLYRRRAALFKRADAIVAVAKDYLALAQKLVPNTPKEVVYWGVNTKDLKMALQNQSELPDSVRYIEKLPGEVWVIYAGTLGDNYDIRTILRAAEILESQNIAIRMMIAGDGPLKEEVISTIKSKGLRKTLYIGSLRADVLTYLYGFCDIALSTYTAGSTVSMPIKAYDYLAAGLPMVNSLERNLGDIVRMHYVGLQYEAENPQSLADAIRELTTDRDMRRTMSENAHKLAGDFDCSVQYEKFVELVERVCAK